MLESYTLKLPKAVYAGKGAMSKLEGVLKEAGATKVALFTDKSIYECLFPSCRRISFRM